MLLAFFGLSLTSSWGNGHATTYRGLLRGLRQRGHHIVFFERDTDWYARHRDLPAPPHARLHLYRDWDDIRPTALATARAADAVIVGSYFPDGIPLLDELLGHSPAPVCFYDMDTPITLAQLRLQRCAYLRADQIPALDLYLSFTGGPMLAELERVWRARQVRPLYCACDETAYRSAARSSHPPVALSFMGTFAPDRQGKFQRLVLAPARRLPRMSFHVAGSMFPEPHTWPANLRYDPHLAPDRHAAFYAASRFTLNLTRQAMVEAGFSPSVRLFEAAAAATAIISDPWPGLADFFQPSREILVADDTAHLVQILLHTSEAAAAALGRAAQQRVLDHHTSAHRAAALESYLERLRRPERARDAVS
ncbi:MAG TPA: glycosyltransferase [Terriglobales bacterium]|nr:glycosyltransferase [Terriglobales bacterium]